MFGLEIVYENCELSQQLIKSTIDTKLLAETNNIFNLIVELSEIFKYNKQFLKESID